MASMDGILEIAENEDLSHALTAALRIATALGDKEFSTWIRLELLGYLNDNRSFSGERVPEYRLVSGAGFDRFGRPLILTDEQLYFINQVPLRHGAAELEELATRSGPLTVVMPEYSELIRESLNVDVIVFQFNRAAVRQLLASIRVELIDRLTARRSAIAALPETAAPPVAPEIFQLKPSIYGIGVDLKALWRRLPGRRPPA